MEINTSNTVIATCNHTNTHEEINSYADVSYTLTICSDCGEIVNIDIE